MTPTPELAGRGSEDRAELRRQILELLRSSNGPSEIDADRIARRLDADPEAVRKELHSLREDGFVVLDASGPPSTCIFIGHGHSPAWKDLRDFLRLKLGLDCIEFNADPVAGTTVTDRLEELRTTATFAFLVMTAEYEAADGSLHARENVIHEVGLFQAQLGVERAIVLIEEGCTGFSNIDGLTTIRFRKGDILGRTEEIRDVLRREGILD